MSRTRDAAAAASIAPRRSPRWRSRMRATSIQAVAASTEARRVPTVHSSSARSTSPSAMQQPRRHATQGVRLGRVGRDGLRRLDQLEGVVDGAGAQELERHAARVEHARVTPAAVPQPRTARPPAGRG